MAIKLRTIPTKTKETLTYLPLLILTHTYNTSKSFLDIFGAIRKSKNAKGASTHEQQDLLRAMLLFASAGLDSMVKQLVRDALPVIINFGDRGVVQQFENFVSNELKAKSVDVALSNINVKTLASLIVTDSPKNALIQRLVDSLTFNSLQSPDQLIKVAAYFGIMRNEICKDIRKLQKVFKVRNKISHEMDIDFKQPRRNRCPRGKEEMIEYTNILLDVAVNFLCIVENKLPKASTQIKR